MPSRALYDLHRTLSHHRSLVMPYELRPRKTKGQGKDIDNKAGPPKPQPKKKGKAKTPIEDSQPQVKGKGKVGDGLAVSSFGRLKEQLRQKIWLYALHDPRVEITIEKRMRVNTGRPCTPPAITRTCRRIREETIKIWLSSNDFEICLPLNTVPEDFIQGAVEWLNRIPRSWHKHIGRLYLSVSGVMGIMEIMRDNSVDIVSNQSEVVSRLRQLRAALNAHDYLSLKAQEQLRFIIEAFFHQPDPNGNCKEALTPVGSLMEHVGFAQKLGNWECLCCRSLSRGIGRVKEVEDEDESMAGASDRAATV